MPSAFALLGILIVSCLMSVAVLGSLVRTTAPGVSRWCVGYGLLAVSSCWILVGGMGAGAITVIGVSFTTLAAVLVLVQGTRQFFGLQPVRRDECIALIVVCAALLYFTCISPNVDARGVLISIGLIYGRIVLGVLALRHAPREGSRYACRLIAAAAWLGALVYAARIVVIVLGKAPTLSFLQPSPWNVALLGLAIVSLPCISTGMVMLAHDQILRRMEKLATIDELTGALTRRAFMEKAHARLVELRERGALMSIAILDIDKFKSVNDSFGHAVGDRLLAHVSAVVSAHLRPGDLFGRLGGEEFAVLFARAGQHDAVAMTNALRIAVERSAADGVSCTLSAGVGGVMYADTLESAMVRADAALYVAKAAGRNRVIVSSQDDESASPRIAESR
ncbi:MULTISPECIES: GGDEF domain-containing protein [unclassified Paraburkholderia]|uniref:GGDEF domain-containing protein n=1 Tax=unclassified Paraburkholderia TaxID=2615204 RepID=UPI002AB225ED|nr:MULTISPECIES: GGDEF domain-containing protein [unclassified Paraburkholderia]